MVFLSSNHISRHRLFLGDLRMMMTMMMTRWRRVDDPQLVPLPTKVHKMKVKLASSTLFLISLVGMY